ncbi:MAG: DUF2252 family protein, partial [Candidatus Eremiobacteraeota bacterium]|nr:DUF2252 family protein [Candidatus Eremiobacteraeota bacterium]
MPAVPASDRATRKGPAMDGKTLRAKVPRSAHAPWTPSRDRDPIAILEPIFDSLLPDLRAMRAQRMLVSPFTYYRGSPAVMAADLAATPVCGITTQICGDAHVGNFGGYATPERRLVFDVNDFDETAMGPWEWDVKRLAASLVLAAHDGGLRERDGDFAVEIAARTYRERMQG